MRMLVTGASGFAGAMLAPQLLAEGHDVRALAREPARAAHALADRAHALDSLAGGADPRSARDASSLATARAAPPAIDIVRGDVLTGEGLAHALDGIDVAYYLIHSMESPSSPAHSKGEPPGPLGDQQSSPFPERERLGAARFAGAAREAGVRRIVYLGGLLPSDSTPASRHLASREAVEEILLEHVPDSVALRAAIVLGARSRSFRLMVRLVERLPALALPPWRAFRIQPIDARDVTDMLAAAAYVPAVAGRSLDIGGPQVLTYGELLERIAALLLLRRPTLTVGLTMTPLTARLAAALAHEDPEFILPLMESLRSDLLPAEDHAAELLGVRLHSPDAAIECALREWEAVEPLAAR
jgi:uncharacterized protein YbjT (DUF2867 family)